MDIDLLDGSAQTFQLDENPAELGSRGLVKRPNQQAGEAVSQSAQVRFAGVAAFDPGPEFTQHRRANPDFMPAPPLPVGALANAVDVVVELLGGFGIESCDAKQRTSGKQNCRELHGDVSLWVAAHERAFPGDIRRPIIITLMATVKLRG